MIFARYWYIALFLISLNSYGQLTDFNFNATATDETCTNNGMIEMVVSNTTSGAEITYELFLAPDFDNSIAETTASSFSGLAAGTYRILASQSLDGNSNSKQVDVVINNLIEVLDFEMSDSTITNCDTTAILIVTVLSGNPISYEIISGPEIRPLQSSNEFANLPSGTYNIRVFDDCGDALSKAYTFNLITNDLSISEPKLPEIYTSCNSADITTIINSNTVKPILYPLIVKFTVFTPTGTVAQTFTQNVATGPDNFLELIQNIDLFGSELFDLEIEITDNCNIVFTETFEIDPNPKVSFLREIGECGDVFFSILVTQYLPPFSLNFTEPSEFNPSNFNANYPGPYQESPVLFGNIDNPVPFGFYNVSVLDACNRTGSLDFSLIDKPLKPQVGRFNNGCASVFGGVRITIPDSRDVVSVLIIEAPDTYPNPLSDDVSAFITADGIFYHDNLPVGDYILFVTDSCGDTYEIEVTVPEFVFGEMKASILPNCSPTLGSIKLSTSNGQFVSMKIVEAPPTYMQTLPYDVSFNINSNGLFYMANLPAGPYKFVAVDTCGFDLEGTFVIVGYTSNSDGFSLTRKCGAFDIGIFDEDESITGKTFWLQKFFPNTNTWGHPYTGAAFSEGTIPNATTAKQLNNEDVLLNIFLLGDFRIIKVFESYNNGNADAKCTDIYAEFTISSELIISGVYNLDCTTGTGENDIVLDVIGVEPFNFKITSPFELDNDDSNIFNDLPEGIYNFQVTDDCGNIKNISAEIGTLVPVARANKPQSMLVCREDGVQFGIFSLISRTPQVLGNQNPNNYNVTYHLSQADADSGNNPLPDGYTNISNPQTIYARVQHKTITVCYATTSFNIFAGIKPILTPVDSVFFCEGFTKTLTAQGGFSSYEWSTGETTQSITVNEAGTYTVTVKNVYDDFSCDTSIDYVVVSSNIATIQTINTSDWSSTNNSIVVLVTGSGDYSYSLDNIVFQTSNTFTDLLPGIYTVYVKDENGCGTVDDEFILLNYPKYFTPNGDGYNETWHVQFSSFEPNLNVDIFDRFGKFIIRLKGGEDGWDGTYNGHELPSTDYWFIVTREDGKEYRGHFSLKR